MRIKDLGKRALFLVPPNKIHNRKYSKSGQNIAEVIHDFLVTYFEGYTCPSGYTSGYYSSSESIEYDALMEYRVAFKEDEAKTKVPELQMFLAMICADIGEECIYLECGEDAMLVYP